MSERDQAASVARPDAQTCICGALHYGGGSHGWCRNWCGTECCWTRETCRSCGATYDASTGVLLHGTPKRPTAEPIQTTSDGVVKVDRDGRVTRGGRLVGYVDRYDQNGRRKPDWRWVVDGGAQSRTRYRTRNLCTHALLLRCFGDAQAERSSLAGETP